MIFFVVTRLIKTTKDKKEKKKKKKNILKGRKFQQNHSTE
jgi:hypothetical protein